MSHDARWEIYFVESSEGPSVITVDLGCEAAAPLAALPELHVVRAAPPSPQGELGTEATRALELRLEALFAAAGARAVGSITTRERREHFWYAPAGTAPRGLAALLAEPARPWGHTTSADPEWRQYREHLLPGAADRRRIQILRALTALAECGDVPEVARPVEYRLLLPERGACESLRRQLRAAGFAAEEAPESAAGMWRLRCVSRHPLDFEELSTRVEQLALLAGASGGRYEGFDTHAVRAPGTRGPAPS